MNWLEIAGVTLVWILGTMSATFVVSIFVDFFARNKELGGLIFIIYSNVAVVFISAGAYLMWLGSQVFR